MNPVSEPIPGLRRPDAREHAWIAEHWSREIERNTVHSNGRVPRFIAIFLAAVGGVSAVRGENAMDIVAICLFLAVCCFGLSCVLKKTKGENARRVSALGTGDYYVADAVSIQIGCIYRRGSHDGFAQVRLSDGRVLEGKYWMPYRLAQPYIEQKIHNIPILVIKLPGEDRIFTIPAPR